MRPRHGGPRRTCSLAPTLAWAVLEGWRPARPRLARGLVLAGAAAFRRRAWRAVPMSRTRRLDGPTASIRSAPCLLTAALGIEFVRRLPHAGPAGTAEAARACQAWRRCRGRPARTRGGGSQGDATAT